MSRIVLNVTITLAVIIGWIFLLINAPAIYGQYSDIATRTLTIYLLLLSGTTLATGLALPQIKITDGFSFFIGFFATAVILLLITGFANLNQAQFASFETVKLAAAFGFLHAFVKAWPEEVVFRDLIPRAIGGGKPNLASDIISSGLFGLFHLAVTGSIVVMGVLAFLGFLWAQARNRIGLLGATGSHFAWNLAALGILGQVIGIGG